MEYRHFELHAKLEKSHWWFRARNGIIGGLCKSLIPPDRKKTVVDIGCGTGSTLAELSESYHCIGIDNSETAIEFAKKNYPHLDFFCGEILDGMDEIARRADVFLLLDVLEHVEDDFELLSGLLRAAKPGAILIITVPADMSLWSLHDVSYGHFRRYSTARLKALWQGLSATELMLSHFNRRLYAPIKAVRRLSRRRGTTGGEAGTDLKMPPRVVNSLLEKIFVGERAKLSDLLAGRRTTGYKKGVSLISILRREQGQVDIRSTPSKLAGETGDSAILSHE